MIRPYIIIFSLLTFNLSSIAQSEKLDSLLNSKSLFTEDTGKINTSLEIANLYREFNPALAQRYIDTAIRLSELMGYDDGLARSFFIKAFIYSGLEQNDSALKWYINAFELFKNNKSYLESNPKRYKNNLAKCLHRIGLIYYDKNNYDSATTYYLKSIFFYKETDNKNLLSKVYKNCGASYQLQGNYAKAIEFYHRSLDNTIGPGNEKHIADCYNNIGTINTEQENYLKAQEYFNQSLEICLAINDKPSIASTYANMANIAFRTGEYEKALDLYKKSLLIFIEVNDKVQTACSYTNLGNVYTMQNKISEALGYYEKAIILMVETKQNMGLAYTYNSLSDLYYQNRNFQKSIEFANKTLCSAKESGILQLEEMAYKNLSYSYNEMGNFKKAYDNFKIFSDIKDSIFNQEKHKQITEIQTKYETEKRIAESKAIEKEKEIYKLKYIIQKKWNYSLTAGFIILALLTTIIFIQKRKQFRTNKILIRRNKEIIESDKELRNQKDELQTILELLQKSEINDEIVSETLKYSGSKLKNIGLQELTEKIEFIIRDKKYYLQSDLTLDKLAKKLNTNRSYISQAINESYNQNFNNFLNEFRIREACIMLSDPRFGHLSIEGIAQEVGFNSITTFNRCFKKVLGMTASAYVSDLKFK